MSKLKALRKKNGLTQKELGEATGLSKITISSYEIGHRRITVSSAKKLAEVLGCDWVLFFGKDENNDSKTS